MARTVTRTITVTVPDVISVKRKIRDYDVEVSYNETSGEVICTVNGLKFMEHPEPEQRKLRLMNVFWEAYNILHSFCLFKFSDIVDLAPVRRELDGMQRRIDGKCAINMSKIRSA